MKHLQNLALASLLALFVPSFALANPADHHNNRPASHQNARPGNHQNARPDNHHNARPDNHHNASPHNSPGGPGHARYSEMSSPSFQSLYNSVKHSSFAKDKLALLTEAHRHNYFSSSQVVSLMKLFTFDDDRANAACALVDRVVDMENWYKADTLFKFDKYHSQIASCANRNSISSGNSRHSMSSSDFNDLYNTVKSLKFYDDRLAVVKSAVKYNVFTSAQTASLMRIFSFDSEQVEVGCAMAPRVIDRGNWFQAVDVLTFSRYRDQLSQCMR